MYVLEVTSPRGCSFWMGKLAYDRQKSSRKEVMLECNKNYAILALNCTLKNSKRIILVLEIGKNSRNNNIKED